VDDDAKLKGIWDTMLANEIADETAPSGAGAAVMRPPTPTSRQRSIVSRQAFAGLEPPRCDVDADDRAPALYCAVLSNAVYDPAVLKMDPTASDRRSVVLPPIVNGRDRAPEAAPSVELLASMDDARTVQWGAFHLKWEAIGRHVLVVAFRGSEAPKTSFLEFWHDWIRTDMAVLFPDTVRVPGAEPTDVRLHRGFNRSFT
jgi:hypothetical protein